MLRKMKYGEKGRKKDKCKNGQKFCETAELSMFTLLAFQGNIPYWPENSLVHAVLTELSKPKFNLGGVLVNHSC